VERRGRAHLHRVQRPVAAGEQTALIDTCASLRDSIDRAVLDGRLPITPP